MFIQTIIAICYTNCYIYMLYKLLYLTALHKQFFFSVSGMVGNGKPSSWWYN